MIALTKRNIILGAITLLLIGGVIGGTVFLTPTSEMNHGAVEYSAEYNKEIIVEKDEGVKNLLAEGRYKCCLTKPCSYCFSDLDHQDEELVCDCLEDTMNGKSPCGECIGEILEGNGNPLISEYFATAIAETIGEDYLLTLKQIMADKYDMPVGRQL
tara:strand:+ start:5788 stop:6258 length:471 start_codon:yes stop_codon:yes gene_type:complete